MPESALSIAAVHIYKLKIISSIRFILHCRPDFMFFSFPFNFSIVYSATGSKEVDPIEKKEMELLRFFSPLLSLLEPFISLIFYYRYTS